MLKISLLFKNFTNFTDEKLENSKDQECRIFRVLLLHEHKHIEIFKSALVYL